MATTASDAETTGGFEYEMPSLGADMDEGKVIEWRVAAGDRVTRGDVVARVETEKSDIDIEIWHDGTVLEVLVPTGRTVAVGTPLLLVGATAGAPPSHDKTPSAPPEPEAAPMLPPGDRGATAPEFARPTGVVWASPLARRLAGDHGIELSQVTGSGPSGAVRSSDVLAHLGVDTAQVEPVRTTVAPASDDLPDAPRADRMRRTIAARMTQSHREIPHYFLERQVDLTPLLAHLRSINAEVDVSKRLLPAAAFVRATALAAARHGELNGHWIDDRFVPSAAVNVAVAVSIRGGGLMTPQISAADVSDLADTMARLRDLTAAARTGVLRSEATATRASITVTNLGDRGADLVHGLISPPEVALVGFGRILDRPWVVNGAIEARAVVDVTLAADHRATDGATGSRFLATIARLLEHPEEL